DVPLARAGSARDVDRIGGSRTRIVREARRQHAASLRIEGGGTRRAGAVLVFDHAVYYVSQGGDTNATPHAQWYRYWFACFNCCLRSGPAEDAVQGHRPQQSHRGLDRRRGAVLARDIAEGLERRDQRGYHSARPDGNRRQDHAAPAAPGGDGLRRHGHLKMAGDDPRFEGCDLAGITLDADKARAGCEAYRSVIDRQMQKNWNARLLA